MAHGSSKPPYGVTGAYEAFVEAFRLIGENADGPVQIPSKGVPACFRPLGGGQAEFKLPLWLKGWPHKKLGGEGRLHVVIQAMEVLQAPDWDLVKSTVYADYYVVSDSAAKLAQCLHYDFVAGGQPGHPLFHVQLSNEPISSGDSEDVGLDLNVEPPAPSLCGVTTRIPTADMTLVSVLYCLVADHLGAGALTEFRDKVLAIQDRLPRLSYTTLKKNIEQSSHFKSSHWFVQAS